MSEIIRQIEEYLKEGMAVIDPNRSQSKEILKALRDYYQIETLDRPLWREFLTFREGTSNKFHYFAVFQLKDDSFVAANAYGRIGYTPKVFNLGKYQTREEAIRVAKNKYNTKIAKGYQTTPLA